MQLLTFLFSGLLGRIGPSVEGPPPPRRVVVVSANQRLLEVSAQARLIAVSAADDP